MIRDLSDELLSAAALSSTTAPCEPEFDVVGREIGSAAASSTTAPFFSRSAADKLKGSVLKAG